MVPVRKCAVKVSTEVNNTTRKREKERRVETQGGIGSVFQVFLCVLSCACQLLPPETCHPKIKAVTKPGQIPL